MLRLEANPTTLAIRAFHRDNRPIGSARFTTTAHDGCPRPVLFSIKVAPEFRHAGVATRMLRHAQELGWEPRVPIDCMRDEFEFMQLVDTWREKGVVTKDDFYCG